MSPLMPTKSPPSKLNKSIYFFIGTVRINRKGLPKAVVSKNVKLKKGESVFRRKGNILCLKWCDKRMVTLISSIHQAVETTVKTNFMGQPVVKPYIVHDYNMWMGYNNLNLPIKYSSYGCTICLQVTLCLIPCYKMFHSKLNYRQIALDYRISEILQKSLHKFSLEQFISLQMKKCLHIYVISNVTSLITYKHTKLV